MAGPVHYELFIRKTAPAPWALLLATEDRSQALETAEDLLKDNRAVAVRVTKETLDPDTMAFTSLTLLNKGVPEAPRKRLVDPVESGGSCLAPQDLYAPHARELLGRVLEDWLHRQGVTPFELLHRPDLAERLEASGVELQHAIQKVSIPESQATGQAAHELIRHYQKLSEAAIERLVKAGRGRLFANLEARPLADVAAKLAGAPDRAFVIGGVISARLADVRGPRARLDRLMDLVDHAPREGAGRALVLVAVEQILCELLSVRSWLADILGPSLDQGGSLAAVVRMTAPGAVETLLRADPRLALLTPTVDGPAGRLAKHLAKDEFPLLASALTRLVVRELTGPRRLRPSDAPGEIEILRVLATTLTATAGRMLTLDEVQAAFVERSKTLVTADFVGAYVADCPTALAETEALVRLCENVMGPASKRSAARWLVASVTSLRLENELKASSATPAQRLALLARLQRAVRGCDLAEHDETQITAALGVLGGTIEAEARLTHNLARAGAPVQHRLTALLRLAAGETGPSGPSADRARAETLRLLRAPEVRSALGAAPESLGPIRALMKTTGLAA